MSAGLLCRWTLSIYYDFYYDYAGSNDEQWYRGVTTAPADPAMRGAHEVRGARRGPRPILG